MVVLGTLTEGVGQANKRLKPTIVFGMGQEQATLKDMISGIKEKFEEDVFSSELFHVDFVNKQAVCPNGKEMIYLGDAFETSSGPHMRFRGYLRKIIDSDDGKQT